MSKKQPQNGRYANGKLSFKLKILLIAVLPIILISGITGWGIHIGANRFIDKEISLIRERDIKTRQRELKNYISMALTAIRHEYSDTSKSQEEAQKAVRRILHNLTYGEDGYFFAYNRAGTSLVNAPSPYLVGENLWYKKDEQGRFFLQDMMKKAIDGGGFYTYTWPKPSTGERTKKLGYSILLPNWRWMIGTGAYLDDIEHEMVIVKRDILNLTRQAEHMLFIVTLAVIAITALAIGVLHFREHRLADEKLKELTTRIVEIQEEERKRVSNELHDGINQLLVSIRHRLELSIDQINKPEKAMPLIVKSLSILDNSIADIRRISKALHPSALVNIGLSEAISELGQEFQESSQIRTEVFTDQIDDHLSEQAKLSLYRVTQEALSNISHHASASFVRIEMTVQKPNRRVCLKIADNGVGMQKQNRKTGGTGLGLRNIFERVESHGGSLTIGRSQLGGFELIVLLPQT
ncbi:cache domain-containing protein [uncultured Cohaesibacter sp.]|uniref:cache domain-containing protein n=1 Tax=uncultured Cohaesibacter sp. TaxID=1002546 RepID=UPI00292EC73A|nr:cache domain-containing protein [uncultured Cohaesibacter sp.]